MRHKIEKGSTFDYKKSINAIANWIFNELPRKEAFKKAKYSKNLFSRNRLKHHLEKRLKNV